MPSLNHTDLNKIISTDLVVFLPPLQLSVSQLLLCCHPPVTMYKPIAFIQILKVIQLVTTFVFLLCNISVSYILFSHVETVKASKAKVNVPCSKILDISEASTPRPLIQLSDTLPKSHHALQLTLTYCMYVWPKFNMDCSLLYCVTKNVISLLSTG